ncbi:MAG: PAS domain S-box protein [archaeon]
MNTFELIDLLNIILAVYLGLVIYLKDPDSTLNRLFLLNCILSGYTALFELLRFTSENPGAAYIYHKLSFVWPFFPIVIFEFAYELSNTKFKSKKVISLSFLFIATLISALHLLTDLLYQNLEHKWYGWNYNIVKNSVSGIIPVFTFTSGLLSFLLVASYYNKLTDERKKRQAVFTSIGIIIPIITAILINEIIPKIGGEVPPLTGLSYLISAVFLFISLLKYKHFSIDPIKITGRLLENLEDYVIIFNSEEKVIQASNSFYYWSGYSENEVVGKNIQHFFRGKDFQPGNTERIIGKELELILIPFSKSGIPLSAVVSKIAEKDNLENFYLLIGRDLRERKHFEQELLDSQKRLEEKVQVRTLELQKEINSRKSIEIALRDSEKRYREIFQNSPIGIYRTSPDGKVLMANPAILRMLKYSSLAELSKRDLESEGYGGISRKYYKEKIEKDSEITGLVAQWIRKDGTKLTIRENAKCIYDDSGHPVYYEGTVEDISEQIQAQEALQESEERYRSIFEGTSEVMLLVDMINGRIVEANNAARDYYGYSLEELYKMNLSELEINDQVFASSADNNLSENSKVLYHKHKLSNGESREVEVHSGIVKIHGNDIRLCIINDITQRRLIEKQLENYNNYLEEQVKARIDDLDFINQQLLLEIKKSRTAEDNIRDQLSFFQILIDTIPSPIYILDINKMFSGCNKAFEDFFNLKKYDIIGKEVHETAPPDLAAFLSNKNNELLKNPGKQQFETSFTLPDGKNVHIIENRATYYKSEGQVEGIVAVIINITEIKEMEHEIRKAYEKEKELSELKSRFISVASHEFRTPLTSILAAADLLELYGRKWPEAKYYEYIGDIQKSVGYLTELINDLLSVSRADTGNITFSPTDINLHELSLKIFENIKKSAKDRQLDFYFKYTPKEHKYFLDDKLITQILTNILSNAVKYSNDGGKVYFSIDSTVTQVLFSVIDTGVGIPEEDLIHLCEPFHRGQNVSAISGTGLGLSIVKRAVELHNGNIIIQSEVNKGTKVIISLNY